MVALAPKPSVHSLGIFLDQGWLLREQFSAVTSRAYFQLQLVFHCIHAWVRRTLVTTVTPPAQLLHMRYVGLSLRMTQKLQLVQNAAVWDQRESNM